MKDFQPILTDLINKVDDLQKLNRYFDKRLVVEFKKTENLILGAINLRPFIELIVMDLYFNLLSHDKLVQRDKDLHHYIIELLKNKVIEKQFGKNITTIKDIGNKGHHPTEWPKLSKEELLFGYRTLLDVLKDYEKIIVEKSIIKTPVKFLSKENIKDTDGHGDKNDRISKVYVNLEASVDSFLDKENYKDAVKALHLLKEILPEFSQEYEKEIRIYKRLHKQSKKRSRVLTSTLFIVLVLSAAIYVAFNYNNLYKTVNNYIFPANADILQQSNKLIAVADSLFQQKDFKAALLRYKIVLTNDTANNDLKNKIVLTQNKIDYDYFIKNAQALIKSKKYQEALNLLNKAIVLEPDSVKIKKAISKLQEMIITSKTIDTLKGKE